MIYLIGGSPRAGKSTLSRMISKELGCSFIALDIISKGLIETFKVFTPEFNYLQLFRDRGLYLESGRNRNLYLNYKPEVMLEAHKTEATGSWPLLRVWIERQIKFYPNLDLVFEGYQLLPELVSELVETYPDQIKYTFLIQTDQQAIRENISNDFSPGNWANQPEYTEQIKDNIVHFLSLIGMYLENQSDKYGLSLINTEMEFIKKLEQTKKAILNLE